VMAVVPVMARTLLVFGNAHLAVLPLPG